MGEGVGVALFEVPSRVLEEWDCNALEEVSSLKDLIVPGITLDIRTFRSTITAQIAKSPPQNSQNPQKDFFASAFRWLRI